MPEESPDWQASRDLYLDSVLRLQTQNWLAERIRELFSEPFSIGEEELECSVSIGISVYPSDASNSRELLKLADAAMYESKKSLTSNGVS